VVLVMKPANRRLRAAEMSVQSVLLLPVRVDLGFDLGLCLTFSLAWEVL
jgi:hypothetical protein